jgi:hypothetical protein
VLHEDICTGLEAGADFVCAKDLVGQPALWQQRLTEILSWSRGRVWRKVVKLQADSPCSSRHADWISIYNRALQLALGRRLSAGLLRWVARRAVLQTLAHQGHDDPNSWLDADGIALLPSLVEAVDPETAACLGASLVEQLWCLLGATECTYFAEALAPVIPGLPKALIL